MSKKILIIEDDRNIADLLEIHINDMGYYLERAEDGEIGLEKATSDQFSLIILDVMLPKLNGFDVCKRIRQEQSGRLY
jgi:DNA-binding response OmpR family regulator